MKMSLDYATGQIYRNIGSKKKMLLKTLEPIMMLRWKTKMFSMPIEIKTIQIFKKSFYL